MVTGDGYGKSSFSLFFLIFLLFGNGYGRWLREMVTGSLCFPLFLDISPFGEDSFSTDSSDQHQSTRR